MKRYLFELSMVNKSVRCWGPQTPNNEIARELRVIRSGAQALFFLTWYSALQNCNQVLEWCMYSNYIMCVMLPAGGSRCCHQPTHQSASPLSWVTAQLKSRHDYSLHILDRPTTTPFDFTSPKYSSCLNFIYLFLTIPLYLMLSFKDTSQYK